MNNFNIKTKLLLLLVVPLIMVFYLSFDIVTYKLNEINNSMNMNKTAQFGIKISEFVHELQIERGLSSGFVSSKGTKFEKELKKQKKTTDLKYEELKNNYINYINYVQETKGIIDKKIIINFKESIDYQDNLLIIRERVSSLNISTKEVINNYTDINTFYLKSINISLSYSKHIIHVNDILAYNEFLLLEETSGILRAEITSILINDSISEEDKLKIINLMRKREKHLSAFFTLADENLINYYNKMINIDLLGRLMSIGSTVLDTTNLDGFKVNEEYWFNLMTQHINELQTVEIYFSKHIMQDCQNYESRLRIDIVKFVSIGILIFLVSLFFASSIARRIHFSIKNIIDGIVFIADGTVDKYRTIKVDGFNELSLIAYTINDMVENLKKKELESLEYNKRILESEKKALESAEAKSVFLANMSHEIRTPLNAILGFIDLLKDEIKKKKPLEYISIIDNSSKCLLKIIEDILDFSKIESGKLEVDKIDFNTKKEFEVITHLFDAKCLEKNIMLSLEFDDNIPQFINTDPLRVKQVISNLISNAVKFTNEDKSIKVNICCKDNILSVFVKDEGIGISEDKLNHIFESFTQEDSSTTRKYGGTGLGLSISSALIKLLGGELKVKSEVGVGSEFYFSIPIVIGKHTDDTICITEKRIFEGKKILLVEDNKANQMFMKVVLKKLLLEYDLAKDGLEAVEMFKQEKYDAILMDENMPNMNGIEATQIIIKLENELQQSHTPIIALTANALKGDRERFLMIGMDEYITKPIDRKQLLEVLGKLLTS